MKISTNKSLCSNFQSFKGIWGNAKSNFYYDSQGNYSMIEKFYYPFKDEKKKSAILKVIKDNEYHYSTTPKDLEDTKKLVAEPMMQMDDCYVRVMERLAFTSKEYADYNLNKVSELKKNVIDCCLKFIENFHKA